MKTINSHIVPTGIEKVRLSDYAIGLFPQIPSRKGIKKVIKRGAVWVNHQPATTGKWIQSGDVIELKDLERSLPKIYERPLAVVYEDDYLAIINKPGGLVVSGNQHHTVQNALLFNLTPSTAQDALRLPRPVHRLDAATCGLLLIAKTYAVHLQLGRQFESHQIQKQYQAIAIGQMPEKGRFDQPIDDKTATTIYQIEQVVPSLRTQFLTLVNLFPVTGRTHQLRKHLAWNGFPILGDKLYGIEGQILRGKGLFLCAVALTFWHPITQKIMTTRIDPPNKFKGWLAKSVVRWQKFRITKTPNSTRFAT